MAPQGLGILAGGGELGALMRQRDWAATPLGDPSTWPQSLRSALSTCLNSRAVSAIYWGPEFYLLYNEAYRPFLGSRHPWALGRTMQEVWPTLWQSLTTAARQVHETGEGVVAEDQRLLMERDGGLDETFWTYSFAPIRDETGKVAGIFLTALSTTERNLAERRQAFRLSLDERLRDLAAPAPILAEMSRSLGLHLGVGEVAYADVEPDGAFATITQAWTDDGAPRSAALVQNGCHRLDDYGPALVAELRRGRIVAIPDVRQDPRTCAAETLAALDRISVAALLNVPLMKAGQMVAILAVHHATPRAWTRGEIALVGEVVARSWDAVERVRAEAALRVSEERLQLALGASGMVGLFDWHIPEDLLYPDERFARVFGVDAARAANGVPHAEFVQAMHPDDRLRVQAAIGRAVETGEPYDVEYRVLQPDGGSRWLHVRGRCLRNAAGEPMRFPGTAVDIHARKLAEERQALLSREVDHRAKNALAVVQAALRLTRAPDLPSYVKAITGRVAALARAQTMLANEAWAGADLRTMLAAEMDAFMIRGPEGAPRATLDGPAVALPAGAAQPLAIVAHELATNAMKHGALSTAAGRVTVRWTRDDEPLGTLRLRWAETGGPPILSEPARRGFGSRVLAGVVHGQLGGSLLLTWHETGLVCDISLPLARIAGIPASDLAM
ncbi:PAS domain-containing sensor histidine kinase [Falsiroseomonas sp.]|uniref:PAS domain-containing sensor histidine kinase n=1 Tax=Falsiroseomonas sp. TaxID=2870721 RepID=UPI0027363C78|nr:PAS domain-containing protein [Falsiroseomonas sp.]MDP3418420.1 PAS domain-containing protein [Falsiroseomonas sp.]